MILYYNVIAKNFILVFYISMKIMTSNFYQPQFMAHTYKISPKSNYIEVRTDNEPYLGDEPYIILSRISLPTSYDKSEIKMDKKENGIYSAFIPYNDIIEYHLDYKDTGKKDLKNGQDYVITNYKNMKQVASVAVRNQRKQPLVHAINPGKTIGRVVYTKEISRNIEKIKEPFIIVTPRLGLNYYKIKNPNLIGVIFTSEDCATLSHQASQLRQNTDVCASVYNPKDIAKLESLNGEKIELEVKDNYIRMDKTDKVYAPKIYPKIDVPKLKPCDKVLTSKEYSTDVIGAKAVNLRRLEELKEQGKIDIIIPKSIALPHGYIQKLWDNDAKQEERFLNNKDEYVCKEDAYVGLCEGYGEQQMIDLRKKLKENGIISDRVIVRSAFNSEDLPNYSAAGLYDSTDVWLDDETEKYNNEELYRAILNDVGRSKWSENAIMSRMQYHIPDKNVQPGALIQDYIPVKYKFTVYTNDDNNKLRLELFSRDAFRYGKDRYQPHVFSYDKSTGELSYDSIQMTDEGVTFNEDGEIIEIDPIQEDLSNNEKILEQIKKVVENALVVEREFGAPQDIEGGLKDDDIYFWQTRNIVC